MGSCATFRVDSDTLDLETFKKTWFSGPLYMRDPATRRYTFEKCIYEAYLAFRGIGGKKPDEGRGRWAQSHLRRAGDPAPIGRLASELLCGDIPWIHYWINHVLEAQWGTQAIEHILARDLDEAGRTRFLTALRIIKRLSEENRKYEALCDEFSLFLEVCGVHILTYTWVFDQQTFFSERDAHLCSVSPACLDGFVRETTIPAEDFEIVYAAMRLGADLFLTDDSRLTICARSLGCNQALTSAGFCSTDEYEGKALEKQVFHGASRPQATGDH